MLQEDNDRSTSMSIRLPLRLRKLFEQIAHKNHASMTEIMIEVMTVGLEYVHKSPQERLLLMQISEEINQKSQITDGDIVKITHEISDFVKYAQILYSKDTKFLAQYAQLFLLVLKSRKEFENIGLSSTAHTIGEIKNKLVDTPVYAKKENQFSFPALEELEE